MQLPPFLLDQWMSAYEFAAPPIQYNLASSTGPGWKFGELMKLCELDPGTAFDDLKVSYVPHAGSEALRRQIAELDGVDPDWVVVTTGASEALMALFCLVGEPGRSVLLPAPGFPAMLPLVQAWGSRVATYKLNRDAGFAYAADGILACVDASTSLVVVNTPHNPTGAVMPYAEIEKLAAALAARNVPLLVDEVYHPLYFGAEARSAADIPNTIVVGDLSKAMSLSGLRIGWLVDRDARRRQRLINLRSYFTICGSPVTESIAAHALAYRQAILSRLATVARRNLASLDQFMATHRASIGWVRPAGGTVAFPWLRDGSNARTLCEALARQGVLMAPGDCFDAPEHVRLGFGAQAEGFERALEITSGVLQSLATNAAS